MNFSYIQARGDKFNLCGATFPELVTFVRSHSFDSLVARMC